MKNKLLILIAVCAFMIPSCEKASTEMDPNAKKEYDLEYSIRQVLEKDPAHLNGLDIYPYFDFFQSLRFKIHYEEEKITGIEFENGDIPFSPYSFDIPEGKNEAYFDTQSLPNAIRLKSNNELIAYFMKGELYIPFQLDCKDINYEYHFKSTEN